MRGLAVAALVSTLGAACVGAPARSGGADGQQPQNPIRGVAAHGGAGGSAESYSGPGVLLRLVNVGQTDVFLPALKVVACGFSITLAGPRIPASPSPYQGAVSSVPPDPTCECEACGQAGFRSCQPTDVLCDEPDDRVPPGAHRDIPWDGRVAIVNDSPSTAAGCLVPCERWLSIVEPGSYVVTIGGTNLWTVPVTLPPANGIVTLPVQRD